MGAQPGQVTLGWHSRWVWEGQAGPSGESRAHVTCPHNAKAQGHDCGDFLPGQQDLRLPEGAGEQTPRCQALA